MNDTSLSPGDVEAIAAFLDRQLSESERRAFLERLDREPALYEVFVETLRYRESEQPGGEVVQHPARRRAWMIRAGVAALLAVAVVGPFLVENAGLPSGSGLARGLVEGGGLAATLEADWYEQGWSRTRGLTPLRSEIDSAFRVGVHAVDLEIALHLERADDAERLLRYIDAELRNVDFSDHLRLSYAEILRQLEQGAPLERALERAAATEPQALELLDIGHGYAFGKWSEAGKLAARSGNEQLLRSREFRKTLDRIRDHEWTELVDRRLTEIETLLTDRDKKLDLPALEQAFTAIIDES